MYDFGVSKAISLFYLDSTRPFLLTEDFFSPLKAENLAVSFNQSCRMRLDYGRMVCGEICA